MSWKYINKIVKAVKKGKVVKNQVTVLTEKKFLEKMVLLEKVLCPLEAGGVIFAHECREYDALKKNKRYHLLKDTEKICNIICPAIGKEVNIHTFDGRTVRGTITRSIDYTYNVKENHVIVSKKTEDPHKSDWEDVFIKDIESIDIIEEDSNFRPSI